MKPKLCPECNQPYERRRMGQKTCPNFACALAYMARHPKVAEKLNKAVQDIQKRARAKSKREGLDSIKPRSKWLMERQKWFNRWVNARDRGKNCIACDKPLTGGVHASHYRTVASSPHLRFDERNCHSGCIKCNVYLVGNIVNYRINLVKRIGVDQVEALEADHSVKKWTIDEIKAGIESDKAKLKEISE